MAGPARLNVQVSVWLRKSTETNGTLPIALLDCVGLLWFHAPRWKNQREGKMSKILTIVTVAALLSVFSLGQTGNGTASKEYAAGRW